MYGTKLLSIYFKNKNYLIIKAYKKLSLRSCPYSKTFLCQNNLGHPKLTYLACSQASTVFSTNMAIVIGPTPPGTGVTKDAFPLISSQSISPTKL